MLQAAGGDDYELCFTASPAARAVIESIARKSGVPAAIVGRIVQGSGIRALTADGEEWKPAAPGYAHFAN